MPTINKQSKKPPEISVVMSAYNAEKYITESIQSILEQTFDNFEFIIIDDSSTDSTKEIIKYFAKLDSRIIPIYNKINIGHKGFIKNLNKGLKIAKGKYIARMDSDDISLPKRLEIERGFLEQNKNIFLIGCGALIIDKNGEIISEFNPQCDVAKLSKAIVNGGQIYHPTIMFRNTKEIFYREKAFYCEDYDLYLNLLTNKKKLSNIPDKLIKYRIVDTSISHKNLFHQTQFSNIMFEFYKERVQFGKDSYNLFNPDDILKRPSHFSPKMFLEISIRSEFGLDNYGKTRALGVEYLKKYGVSKVLIYPAISLFGTGIIKILRKFNIAYKKIKLKK